MGGIWHVLSANHFPDLARRLKANGWKPGESLHFEKVEGGTHDEASWAKRVRAMLKFLFPRSSP